MLRAGTNRVVCPHKRMAGNVYRIPITETRFARVYLKTHDVTGSERFLRCARHFFAGILTYFKEK